MTSARPAIAEIPEQTSRRYSRFFRFARETANENAVSASRAICFRAPDPCFTIATYAGIARAPYLPIAANFHRQALLRHGSPQDDLGFGSYLGERGRLTCS